MNLFNINQEFISLINEINENGGEVTPEQETKLQISNEQLIQKSVSYFHVIQQIESESVLLDNEIKRLQDLKKSRENTIQRLKDSLLFAMDLHGIDEIDTETLKISIRKSKAIDVIDLEQLPFECLKIEKKAIKSEIKKLIESGVEVKGAKMIENKTVNFK